MTFDFAHLVLAIWLPLALGCFFFLRPTTAGIVVVLAGMLFLPQRAYFDGPGIPPLGKHEISQLAVLVGCLFFARKRLARARPFRGLDVLVLVLMASAYFTVAGNHEALIDGPSVRPPLTSHDFPSIALGDALMILLPFVLGRALVDGARDARTLVRLLVGFGLAYAGLMLIEVRLSPQLHNWIYGYHAHDFIQTMRWGGYRPTVFMAHGLAVGMFALAVVVAAATRFRLWRSPKAMATVVFLMFMLVVCKSTGSIVLGLIAVPIALWSTPRRQVRLAALLALLCFVYPVAKLSGAFPEKTITKVASSINVDRAESLEFRFTNERLVVERSRKKLFFGWGGFARSHVFTDWGQDMSVTDGQWIILFGERGLVGFFCAFGVLLFPVFSASRALKKVDDREHRLLLGGLALLVACYGFDLLPNGLFTNVPYFFAGALARISKTFPIDERRAREEAAVPDDAQYA